jgi:anti-sigma factor RsiW
MTASIRQPPADDPSLLVHAYLDGELDPANALAMEGRIAADPELAAERDRILLVRRLIRKELKRELAPSDLRARVETVIGVRRPSVPRSWLAFAASIAVAVVLSSSSTWFLIGNIASNGVEDAVVASHIRGLMSAQSVDVASSDRHTVKPWFNGRIAQSPRVVDLATAGFPLVGGRIDVVDLKPVPTLVYRRNQHVISLVAITSVQAALPPVRRTVEGYHVVSWTAEGVTYWAVSDVATADLEEFAERFRSTR